MPGIPVAHGGPKVDLHELEVGAHDLEEDWHEGGGLRELDKGLVQLGDQGDVEGVVREAVNVNRAVRRPHVDLHDGACIAEGARVRVALGFLLLEGVLPQRTGVLRVRGVGVLELEQLSAGHRTLHEAVAVLAEELGLLLDAVGLGGGREALGVRNRCSGAARGGWCCCRQRARGRGEVIQQLVQAGGGHGV